MKEKYCKNYECVKKIVLINKKLDALKHQAY